MIVAGSNMKIGYARVSTLDQNLDLQIDALTTAGCEKIFQETISGISKSRPIFDEAINFLRSGDTLVVWRLDRLGRNQLELLRLLNRFEENNILFISLMEGIDTTTPIGKFFYQIIAAIAEMERNHLLERTNAGRAASIKRGVTMGRPNTVSDDSMSIAIDLKEQGRTHKEIYTFLNLASATYFRALRNYKKKLENN